MNCHSFWRLIAGSLCSPARKSKAVAILPSKTNTVTTMVTDEKFLKFMKFILDIIERVRKGSLNPDVVTSVLRPLIGQGYLELPPLTREHKLKDLIKRPDIYGFFGTIENLSVIKPSGKTLTTPHPKPLGKVTTEREMLKRFPGCKDLDEQELTEAVKKLVPEREVLLGAMVNAIIESEEGRASLIPTVVGTWTLGFCVQNEELQVLYCHRYSDGWRVYCGQVVLGDEWLAGFLLLLAMDTCERKTLAHSWGFLYTKIVNYWHKRDFFL